MPALPGRRANKSTFAAEMRNQVFLIRAEEPES